MSNDTCQLSRLRVMSHSPVMSHLRVMSHSHVSLASRVSLSCLTCVSCLTFLSCRTLLPSCTRPPLEDGKARCWIGMHACMDACQARRTAEGGDESRILATRSSCPPCLHLRWGLCGEKGSKRRGDAHLDCGHVDCRSNKGGTTETGWR